MASTELERPDLDTEIWKRLGIKSAKKIADELGLKPTEVAQRTRELLEGVDALTLQQQRMKIMVDLQTVVNETIRRARNAEDERNIAGLYNSATNAMKAVLTQLNLLEDKSSSEIDRLNELRVRELLKLVDSSVKSTLAEIADTYDLDRDALLFIFQRHLVEAAQEVE